MAFSRVVTVLLPLEPVMATTGAGDQLREQLHIADDRDPAGGRRRDQGFFHRNAGTDNHLLGPLEGLRLEAAEKQCDVSRQFGAQATASAGGCSRLSTTATGTPRCDRKRATDRPVLPSPTTSVLRAVSNISIIM